MGVLLLSLVVPMRRRLLRADTYFTEIKKEDVSMLRVSEKSIVHKCANLHFWKTGIHCEPGRYLFFSLERKYFVG